MTGRAKARGPERPPLRYFGGKWKLAPWIIAHLPPHRIWGELYGGAASVTLRKPPSPREVYNDLDGEVVNLFRVLQGHSTRLQDAVALTPYAHAEYTLAHEEEAEVVERARRLLIRSQMSHGTNASGIGSKKGFRVNGTKGSTHVAREWRDLPAALAAVAERFLEVVIENRPALELMAQYDAPDVLLYLDPPYVLSQRSDKVKGGGPYHGYEHEMEDADHVAMLEAANASKSMIVLSGYESELYEPHLKRWDKTTKKARAHRNSSHLETLWLNPAAAVALRNSGPLFERAGA